jgi:hypothetical protein
MRTPILVSSSSRRHGIDQRPDHLILHDRVRLQKFVSTEPPPTRVRKGLLAEELTAQGIGFERFSTLRDVVEGRASRGEAAG